MVSKEEMEREFVKLNNAQKLYPRGNINRELAHIAWITLRWILLDDDPKAIAPSNLYNMPVIERRGEKRRHG